MLQNLVFLAIVAALLALHVHEVDAERSRKGFVFALVTLYGFLVTFTSSNIFKLLPSPLSDRADDYMYAPRFLVVLAAVNATLFAAMMPIMRALGQAFAARISPSIRWRMTALLALLVVTLFVGGWLPPLEFEGLYFTLSFVITVDCIVFIWWMLRMVRDASVQADREERLRQALRTHERAREELSDELARTRERMEELERQAPPTPATETPVVLSTPRPGGELPARRGLLRRLAQPGARHTLCRRRVHSDEHDARTDSRGAAEGALRLLPPLHRGEPSPCALSGLDQSRTQ